jgi:flagellar assembly factor FliW
MNANSATGASTDADPRDRNAMPPDDDQGGLAMQVSTSRFGGLRIEEGDVFLFPRGLIGLEEYRQWILLGDGANDAVGWLQSTTSAEMAVAVISPRRFIPDYRVHVARRELLPLQLTDVDEAFVLNIVTSDKGRLTVNLRAPLLFNLAQRLGRQVITVDEQPIQWELAASPLQLRKSA